MGLVYVFDVDGVLSDVFVDKIDSEILTIIASKIDEGYKVAFNTGRPSQYIYDNVIDPLRGLVSAGASLDNILIVAEMGGQQTTFSKGKPKVSPTEFSMTSHDIQAAADIFNRAKHTTVKFESDKPTMVTMSIIKGSDQATFLKERDELHKTLSKRFANEPVEIITTVGSVDLFAQGAGKRGGAKIISQWLLESTDVKHDTYVCFGDSPSDYAMAEYLAERGMHVSFVFTGKDEQLQLPREKTDVPIIRVNGLYTAATKAYFKAEKRL